MAKKKDYELEELNTKVAIAMALVIIAALLTIIVWKLLAG